MGGREREDGRNEPRVHRYELPGGWIVLAGRSDLDNDLLTFRTASQRDWWFHVRGQPGSHVLLLAREGQEPERATLEAAAAVAAYHSCARTGGVAAVSATQAKNVAKPRGAPPGQVQIRGERVLKVRPALPESAG